MSSQVAAKAAQAGSRVMGVSKKYTVQSYGIWELIRRFLAVDPSRSNGVPLNPQFRNPPPGSNPPHSFVDPHTVPAADIADNPYWKRDSRRSYPQLSTATQSDIVSLLQLGSASAPKQELIGDAGTQALVAAKKEGETGLAAYFVKQTDTKATLAQLGKDGLPPTPSGASLKVGADKYDLTAEQAYAGNYPCRTFQ